MRRCHRKLIKDICSSTGRYYSLFCFGNEGNLFKNFIFEVLKYAFQELMHGEPHPIDDPGASASEEETEDWMPDPVDAPPGISVSNNICTYWLSGRARWENIWLEVLPYRLSSVRSVQMTKSQIFSSPAQPYSVNKHFIIWPNFYHNKGWRILLNLRVTQEGWMAFEQDWKGFSGQFTSARPVLITWLSPMVLLARAHRAIRVIW